MIIIILAYTARSRIIIILAYLAGLFLLRRIGKIGGYGIVYSRPLLYERTALKKLRLNGVAGFVSDDTDQSLFLFLS